VSLVRLQLLCLGQLEMDVLNFQGTVNFLLHNIVGWTCVVFKLEWNIHKPAKTAKKW